MRCTLRVSLPILFLMPAWGACQPDEHVQANAPPQGYGSEHPVITEYYVYHNDQGMLADRCIADIHFIPHTTDLSATGLARLERYAELLATSGGTLHYDTMITDEILLAGRLETATAFLAEVLPSTQSIEVVRGMAGGPGMTGQEAIDAAAVAQQPEPRGTAYKLAESSGG